MNVNYGQNYFYWIRAEDNTNHLSAPGNSVSGMPLDLPPAVPLHITAVVNDDGSVDLTWNPNSEPDLAKYVVYRGPGGPPAAFEEIGSSVTDAFRDQLDIDGEFVYKLKAEDDMGNRSDFSASAAVTWKKETVTGLKTEEPVSVHPNPAASRVIVQGIESGYNYKVLNSSGQLVLEGTSPPGNSIDLDGLGAGLYLLKIHTVSQEEVLCRFMKL